MTFTSSRPAPSPGPRARTRFIAGGGALALLLALFIGLGVAYSIVTPVLESPDEVFHYPYVSYVGDGHGLPVQRPDEETCFAQEGSQPPLYYVLAAAVTFWIDDSDLASVRYLNPHARIGIPLAEDNKNIVVHRASERLPWRGTLLAVHLARLLSLLMGAGTVLCTWHLGRAVFPRRPEVVWGGTALVALNPQFLFISASVNNDNLVTLLAALALLEMIRLVQQGSGVWERTRLGAIIGLACLAKLSGLALIPLAGLTLAFRQAREVTEGASAVPAGRRISRWLAEGASLLAPVVVVAGWWYLRNWRLYGDPLGLSTMLDVFGRRSRAVTPSDLWGEFQGLRISFWGLFGVVNVLLKPTWVYHLLDVAMVIAAAGLVAPAVRWCLGRPWLSSWRRHGEPVAEVLLMLVWIAGVAISLVRWTMMTKATQGRLLFPAISAIALLGAWGFLAWFPGRWRPRVMLASVILLGLMAGSAPWTAIAPAYARPPVLTVAEVPAAAHTFNTTYGGQVRLLAYEVKGAPVPPGGALQVRLYWQALAPLAEDYTVYMHLFGRGGQRLGQRDSHLGMGTYPSSTWVPGEVIQDTYLLPVTLEAIAPVGAELEVGVYRHRDMQRLLPVTDGLGRRVGRPILTRVKIAAPLPAEIEPPQRPLDASLGGRARLVGCDLDTERVAPGGAMTLTLHWEVSARLERDYAVFVHLLDAQGALIGQGDGPPLDGEYPTSMWGPGERLRDVHLVTVFPDAAAGEATLWAGLYDPETGIRLPLVSPKEAGAPDSAVRIATVRVTAP